MPSKQEDKPVSFSEMKAAILVLHGRVKFIFSRSYWRDLTPEQRLCLKTVKHEARELYLLLGQEMQRREFRHPGGRR